jgi:hypothetical protein
MRIPYNKPVAYTVFHDKQTENIPLSKPYEVIKSPFKMEETAMFICVIVQNKIFNVDTT